MEVPRHYLDLLEKRVEQIAALEGEFWVDLTKFFAFCVHTKMAPQAVEDPFFDIVVRLLNRRRSHKLFLFPRGHTKTSVMKALAAFLAVEGSPHLGGDRVRIAFVGETLRFSKRNSRALRRSLEVNSHILENWGLQKPDSEMKKRVRDEFGSLPEWSMESFRTLKCLRAELEAGGAYEEPTCTALGMDVSSTGSHFDVIIIDDPVTEKSAKSPTRKKKTESTYFELQSQLNPGGLMIVVGTRHALDDLHNTLIQEYSEDFELEVHNVWAGGRELYREDFEYNPDSQEVTFLFDPDTVDLFWDGYAQIERDVELGPLPPKERKTVALKRLYLDKIRKMPPARWAHQFLNRAVSEEDQIFFEWMFKPYAEGQVPRRTNTYILTDSATGTDMRSSFRVVAAVSLDADDCAYVRELQYGYWAAEDYMTRALDAYYRWGARGLLFESVAWQDAFKAVMRLLCQSRGTPLPKVLEVGGRTVTTKIERIEKLEPRLREGKLLFDTGLKKTSDPSGKSAWDELVRQFCQVSEAENVRGLKLDIPDAISDIDHFDKRGMRVCRPPRKLRSIQDNPRAREEAVMKPYYERVAASRGKSKDIFRRAHEPSDIWSKK